MSSEMSNYLKLLSPKVADNVDVVAADQLAGAPLLHISTDPKIRSFIPCVSERTLYDENRSVPRVCTAPTVIGCLMGYQAQAIDFHNNDGIYVYGIPFEEALKPNRKLLPDVKCSDEHWLVPYCRQYAEYSADVMSRMFIYTLKYYATKDTSYDIELYVEVLQATRFSARTTLQPGYWQLIIPFRPKADWDDVEPVGVTKITKSAYVDAKRSGEINIKHPTAPSSKW